MANSYSLRTSAYQGRYLILTCTQTQNISANTSTIKWTLKSTGGTSSYYSTGPTTVKINGQQVYYKARVSYSSQTFPAATGSTSGTITVSHNNEGNKSVAVSLSTAIYTSTVSTVSGTWALDSIPRAATVSQILSSKTETTAAIKWTANATIDYIWYSTNNGSNWTGIDIADGTSGTYTISGLTAGTTYQIKTRVRRKDSQLTTDSAALSVTTYNYPYANSMPNFTIGERLTIGIYNPIGRSVTINLLGADNSICGTDTISGTSISGYNDSTAQGWLYASIPNSQSGTYKVKVTYGNNVDTKTGGTYSVNTSVCSPSIGSVIYRDTNATAVGITGNNQQIVRNISTVQYTANGLTAQYSATIQSCQVAVNNSTYNLTISGTTATGGNAVIDSGTNVDAVFTITDSRGLTATKAISVTMLDWALPSAIITLQRRNNFYSETDITVDADYSSIDNKNTITITYKAKKVTDTAYSVSGTLADNVQSTIVLDNNYAWQVVVTLIDGFGGTTTYNLQVPRGMPIIYFDRLKSSVGIGCFPQDDQSLEVSGINILTAMQKNIMTAWLDAAITNLAASAYTQIVLTGSRSTGNKLTLDSGGIKIGADVNYIKVSAQLGFNAVGSNGSRHMRIVKNSYTNDNTMGWSYVYMTSGCPEIVSLPPIMAPVNAGDIIYIWYYTPDSSDTIGGDTYGCRTSLTVEAV